MNLHQLLMEAGVTNAPDKLKQVKVTKDPWAHQVDDIKHLMNSLRASIFNDAGVGKTLAMQASALMHAALGNQVVAVMPPALLGQWVEELHDTYPGSDKLFLIETYEGSVRQREKRVIQWEANGWPDIIVMSYDQFRNWHRRKPKKQPDGSFLKPMRHHPLKQAGYNVLIFDEAHKLKNSSSGVHKILWSFVGRHVDDYVLQLFTGSPIPNTLADAYGLIRLVDPFVYQTKRAFEQKHCVFDPESEFRQVIGFKNESELYEALYNKGRRVTKQEVLKNLPPYLPIEQKIKLTPAHRSLYKRLCTERVLEFNGQMIDATHHSQFQQLALQLLSNPNEYSDKPIDNAIEDWFEELLESIGPREHKVIVFAYFKATVKHLAQKYAEYNPAVIFGETEDSEAERQKFVNDDSCRMCILNIDSGGVGLNLQIAHYIIFYETPITPMQIHQGIARAHRGGQTKAVRVYVPRIQGTIASRRLSKLLAKEQHNNLVVRDQHKLLHELLGEGDFSDD